MRPLKLGIFLDPSESVDNDGQVTAAKGGHELRTVAQRAEALGFDSLWVPDHLLFRWEGEAGPTLGSGKACHCWRRWRSPPIGSTWSRSCSLLPFPTRVYWPRWPTRSTRSAAAG